MLRRFQPKNFGFKKKTNYFSAGSLILLLHFLLAIYGHLNAQNLSERQKRIIRQTIASQFGKQEADNAILDPGACGFCICGRDTFYNPSGYFYVFKLIGDSCARLDKSVFHGYNFFRNLFSFENEIYALGGYGGFKSNNLLLKYGRQTNEWYYIDCQGAPPPNILGAAIIENDTLISFANLRPGNDVVPDQGDSCVYKLSLKTKIWQKQSTYFSAARSARKFIIANDYLVWISQLHTVIAHTSEKKYIRILNEPYKIISELGLKSVSEDNKIVLSADNYTTKYYVQKLSLNLDSIWKDNQYKHEDLFKTAKEERAGVGSILLLLTIIPLFALGVFARKKLRLNTSTNDEILPPIKEQTTPTKEASPIFEKVCSVAPTTVNIDQLDELLEISHLSFDSKKLKRHRLIKELNSENPDLIKRERSQEDQRQFIYKINKVG
jgi:hypothetical protein